MAKEEASWAVRTASQVVWGGWWARGRTWSTRLNFPCRLSIICRWDDDVFHVHMIIYEQNAFVSSWNSLGGCSLLFFGFIFHDLEGLLVMVGFAAWLNQVGLLHIFSVPTGPQQPSCSIQGLSFYLELRCLLFFLYGFIDFIFGWEEEGFLFSLLLGVVTCSISLPDSVGWNALLFWTMMVVFEYDKRLGNCFGLSISCIWSKLHVLHNLHYV